ncbi:hypothetical protein SJAG_03106 [Schizosaccharomyces japonicus yFS275]|uniref:A-kinase anchor protein 7-like phosphoesterase domain-containing protein n=1 Tax=Schizosaccharomyces japonicus (strain yFS275 / FY16936) TaxID=402676 RepID=B6K3C2_SCHJY|nr:hypothetical protein SJAG_03106 [Schizosaccharomyces japonicus yFS275]EEB07979.1 hypothetical protein SJAG_03106 [Schizosaccharomyces japonicus yFS275]
MSLKFPNLLFLALPIRVNENQQKPFRKFLHSLPEGPLKEAFQGPRVCHLTIGMIPVKCEDDLNKVLQFMEDKRDVILKQYPQSPITISLRGTDYFGSEEQHSRVLFAVPVESEISTGNLKPFCEFVRQLFVDGGIIRDTSHELNLHCTLLNVRHMRKFGYKEKSFDATQLLRRFSLDSWTWTSNTTLDELSIMKTGAIGPKHDMFYMEIATVLLHPKD